MATTPTPEYSTTHPIMYGPGTVYADSLAQLALGPFVSKLTFGVDRKIGEALTPVQTIALPTPALLALAVQVLTALQTPALRAGFKGDVDSYAASIASGVFFPAP